MVNDIGGDDNAEIQVGGCRHVDVRKPPFSLEAESVDFKVGNVLSIRRS